MKYAFQIPLLGFGLLFGLISLNSANATTVLALDLQALADVSSNVVLGRVSGVFVEGQQTPRRIETVIQIEVEACLLGQCEKVLTLRQLGGQFAFSDGVFHQRVSGLPRFEIGERVVVFVERTAKGRLVVAGLSQGKFTVEGDSADARLSRALDGLSFAVSKHVQQRTRAPLKDMPQRLDVLQRKLSLRAPVIDLRPTVTPKERAVSND